MLKFPPSGSVQALGDTVSDDASEEVGTLRGLGTRFRIDREGRLDWLCPTRALTTTTGWSGGDWMSAVHEDDRELWSDALQRLRGGGTDKESVLCRYSDRGRAPEWTRWYLESVEGGSIEGWVLNVEEEQQAFEQYRLGIEASPTGLLMVDDKGRICLVNRQIEIMFGYEREGLLGEPVEVLLPRRYRGAHLKLKEKFLSFPNARSMGQGRELFGMRSDGSEFSIEIGLNPLNTNAGTRVLASIVDVSDRRAQEEELRSRVADLQRYRREMDLLSEMSSLLQHTLDQKEAHDIVAAFGVELLDAVEVGIYSLRPSRNTLELQCRWGPDTSVDQFAPEGCWALRRSQIYRTQRNSQVIYPSCAHTQPGAVCQMCIPMSAHGQSIGLVTLSCREALDPQEHSNLERIAKAIADQLALAVSNITLRNSLQNLAIRDPLTGLFNRRFLEDTITRELARARRHRSALSVWMLDIDQFKSYLDTRGHQAADDALVRFSNMLRGSLRSEDIACRFGGEEFLVLLPDCGSADAFTQADTFRRAVADSELELTVSIGVSSFPDDGEDWGALLRRADAALYEAKGGGRNRVSSSARPR